VNKFYGGAGLRPSEDAGAKGADSRQAAATASTYTPEEARMAEQYARDAMADAAPDLTGERRAYQ